MFEVGGRLCGLYCPVTSDPLQNRGLHAFYTARQPESDSELFVGKIVIDLSISARPLGYDALSVPLQAPFPVAPEQLKMFYKRNPVTNAPSLELYHPLADDASRFKCAVWDLQQNKCKFQKEVAAFEWIEEGGRIWSLKWQETYYMVKKRMVDWMIARPNMDDYVPPHYLHRKNGEFGWLMPKKSNGNPNFFPDKCLTKMAKEAKFEKWAPILKNHALLYNDHQFQILDGPVRLEILNPFTKNGESMVLDGHMGYGLYTDEGKRYLTSVGAEPDNYMVLAEGSDFLEHNFGGLCGSGSRLPEMPSDGFGGWDLKYMANDVYLLTLERFYLWSSVTRKVSSVALPIRGCIDGPKNRIHAIVSDYRNDFNTDVFVVVDEMVLRFNVEPRDETLQLCNLYSPGVGRITAWTATTCKKTIPITSYMITNLVTCNMRVCIDGRSFMNRGEPSHLGELENGFLEGDPLLKL
ncbi:unnamed protein product, partial [Mesorhabditis spiculigera]